MALSLSREHGISIRMEGLNTQAAMSNPKGFTAVQGVRPFTSFLASAVSLPQGNILSVILLSSLSLPSTSSISEADGT